MVTGFKSYAEKLPAGTFQLTSRAAAEGYNVVGENWNWYFAVGGYVAWAKGKVRSPGPGGDAFAAEFEYLMYDRYNWDKGKSVVIAGIVITDEFMGEFHRQGEAQEFDERGSFKRVLQWRRGQPISEDQL